MARETRVPVGAWRSAYAARLRHKLEKRRKMRMFWNNPHTTLNE
jgi:hypothetical protein